MKNATILGAALAGALAFTTPSFAKDFVSEIVVETDLSAIGNAEASEMWANLPADLQTRIANRLVHQTDEDGARIHIDIDEVSLVGGSGETFGIETSVLKGDVKIREASVGTNDDYTLTVTAEDARAFLPEAAGEAPEVDPQIFYDAMVEAFADNVASKLQ